MNREIISERLVLLRGERPSETVAIDNQVSCSALTAYEIGERIPRDEIKIRLANYYGVSVKYLFN